MENNLLIFLYFLAFIFLAFWETKEPPTAI